MTAATTNTNTIFAGNASARNYRTTSSLQTKRHTVASVTLGQEGFADTNEARYWTQKLGIGNSKKYNAPSGSGDGQSGKKYAYARQLYIPPFHRREAIAQQVLFGPLLTSKHPPFAVVSGPRVNLYGTSTTGSAFVRALYQSGTNANSNSITRGSDLEPDRSVQTGGNVALCGSFRNDGRLLAVGTDAGEARVCDVSMRATLTTFSANSFPVRSLQWFRNGQYMFAGGDDGIARIWDLGSTEKTRPMVSLVGHGDVIRCTALWQEKKKTTASAATVGGNASTVEWSQLAVTGSYDHTVRVWNVDNVDTPDAAEKAEGRCLATLTHGYPVESVCFLKSSNEKVPVWLLSAGGTTIKIWNPLSGQCFGTFKTHHRKTITSVLSVLRTNYEDDETKKKNVFMRVLTASLDGVVQIHSWNDTTGQLGHLYSTKLTDSITSVATDKTGDRFAFGTISGHVLFKMKGPSVTDKKRKAIPKAGTYSFFQRGMNAEAGTTSTDYTVASKTKKQRKLNKYNYALKQFRYAEALDEVLSTRHPKNIAGVLEELGKRRGLTHALSNRDEETLEPLLRYVTRYIKKPDYTSILVGVAHSLIDIYGDVAGESEAIDGLFRKLRHQIQLECKTQKCLMFLMGQIEASMK
jgi:U3 small nucleolar RNA-associated protein 15